MENYTNYLLYIKSELNKLDSPGANLVIDKLSKFNEDNLSLNDVREMCKLVEFLEISENNKIFLYHEWYKYLN